MLPAKFGSIWPSSFRGEDFFNISQSETRIALGGHLIPFGQQTWPLLLKIEHRVKLHVFGNNSKTVNNIRNLTWIKMISTGRSKTLANQKQELPLAAIFVGGMGRNEETLLRTLYRCFLPSLVPFGPVVSEE
jgi:diphthamide biosynthesis methyltransferase